MMLHSTSTFSFRIVALLLCLLLQRAAVGGESRAEIDVYRGTTPVLDGKISEGEYEDVAEFVLTENRFQAVTDAGDLSVHGFVKHDGEALYFAFDVTDDVLYGIDTPCWLPDENEKAHEFSQTGWSWFGDGVEIMMNPSYVWFESSSQGEGDRWEDIQYNDGSGRSWQMVCNATKSWKDHLKAGGLMPGEQRVNKSSFQTYLDWIAQRAMEAVVKPKDDGKGYVIEWRINFDPCIEVKPGVFWDPSIGVAKIGFNMALQDLDEKEKGEGTFGNLHHEQWWTGADHEPYLPKNFGTMVLHPDGPPDVIAVGPNRTYKTIAEGQHQARKLVAEGLRRDVLVRIDAGRYPLSEPLLFTAEDSGTAAYSVTYVGEASAESPHVSVMISGGVPLTGWRKKGDGMWEVEVPGKQNVRQLFRDGKRLPRAKYPNEGYLRIVKFNPELTRLEYDGLPEFSTEETQVELVNIYHWAIHRGIVEHVKGNSLQTKTPMGWLNHIILVPHLGAPGFLENALSFIDVQDEWAFNPNSRMITWKAPEGLDPNEHEFIVPVCERLLVLEGTLEQPIQNLHFQNLDFEHTVWDLPSFGYRPIQAGYHGTSEKPPQPVYCQPAAIEQRYASDSSFEFCRVANTGASGLSIGEGCQSVKINGCRIEGIGCNGIHVGHRTGPLHGPTNILDKDWDSSEQIPVGNQVTNNLVRTCGQESYDGVGIFDAFTQNTRIAHNIVTKLPYTGISIGFRWSTVPSSQSRCTVEYNQIFNVMNTLADGGGIYTLGFQPGTVLRGNLIYDVHRNDIGQGAPNNGIFFDEGTKGLKVEGNIIFATAGDPTRHNKNKPEWQAWERNYFGVGPDSLTFPWRKAALAGIEPAYKNKVVGSPSTTE